MADMHERQRRSLMADMNALLTHWITAVLTVVVIAMVTGLSGCASGPGTGHASGHAPGPAAVSFPDKLLDLGTAYEQGTFHRIGSGLCDAVNKARERTQVRCVAYASSGPDYNLQATAEGVFRLGMALSAMSRAPFPDSTRHLLTLYDAPLVVIARSAAGITDLRQLQGKRVEIGTPTSGRRLIVEQVLDALGVQQRSLGGTTQSATTTLLVDAFCRGDVDVIIEGYGLSDANFERLVRDCAGQLVPLPDDVRNAMEASHPGLERVDLPVQRYTGVPGQTLATLHQQVVIVTDEKTGSEALTRFLLTTIGATAQIRKLDPHLDGFNANEALAPLPHLQSHPAVLRMRAGMPGLAGSSRRAAATSTDTGASRVVQ